MTNLTSPRKIEFPETGPESQRQILAKLYRRKATVELLIQSLEAYAECRMPAEVMTMPLRGN